MMNIFIFVPLMSVLHFICEAQSFLRKGNITFYDEQKSWADAQNYCRTHHVDLIRNETDNLPSNFVGWIGLHRVWKWSGDDGSITISKLPDGADSKNCVYIKDNNNKWETNKCNEKRGFICYDEKLVLVKENKTWEEALEHCRSMKEGKVYILATLTTTDDHNFAREKAQLATTEEVWTGLRYLGDEWFWVAGEPMQYQNIPRCPAQRCGVLEKNGNSSFGMRDCNERRNFFCYIKS